MKIPNVLGPQWGEQNFVHEEIHEEDAAVEA